MRLVFCVVYIRAVEPVLCGQFNFIDSGGSRISLTEGGGANLEYGTKTSYLARFLSKIA